MECFFGHCIANPDAMCAEEGVSDFVRLDLESQFLVTSVFVAILTGSTTSYWYVWTLSVVYIHAGA